MKTELEVALEDVLARIERAAARAGRSQSDVTLVAVSKTHPAERVAEAAVLGLRHFGENRIQEAVPKIEALAGRGLVWHLVGHLQSNKAAKAVEHFDLIHSIDDPGLAAEVARRAGRIGKRQRVLVQVNCSGEASKSGCAPSEFPGLARAVAAFSELQFEGLMTIGPLDSDPESARPAFRQLRRLRDDARATLGLELPHLSMGMTDDLDVAVEEGSTLVRVGTALFGRREYPPVG